jgi:PAS domain-containing protein
MEQLNKYEEIRKKVNDLLKRDIRLENKNIYDDIVSLIDNLGLDNVDAEIAEDKLHKFQKLIESAIKKHDDLFNFIPIPCLMLSSKGLIIDSNPSAADLLGKAQETLLEKPLDSFINENSIAAFRIHLKKTFENIGMQHDMIEVLNSKGDIFYTEFQSRKFYDELTMSFQCRTIMTLEQFMT